MVYGLLFMIFIFVIFRFYICYFSGFLGNFKGFLYVVRGNFVEIFNLSFLSYSWWVRVSYLVGELISSRTFLCFFCDTCCIRGKLLELIRFLFFCKRDKS